MSTGPLTETRENLSEILDDVASTGEAYVITRHGRPAAVLLSYDEYESLVETVNVLSDDDTMEALAEADEDIAEGRIDLA
jgi:prevent-host-death family protein